MSRGDLVTAMCEHARSLFARGFTVAAGGNLSHRFEGGFLMEATATSLGRLRPEDFVLCGTPRWKFDAARREMPANVPPRGC